MRSGVAALCVAIALGAGTAVEAGGAGGAAREVASPAGPASMAPNLQTGPGGKTYLSWIESLPEKGHALKFSVWDGRNWSPGRDVVRGEGWFANWADFPSLVALDGKSLAAHWLQKNGPDTFHYEVRLTRSGDGGRTWGPPVVPHKDGTTSEHGFVSLLPWEKGRVAAVWLDGRNYVLRGPGKEAPSEEMTLRFATVGADGRVADEAELDARVCDCCQTSAALTSDGAVVAYRDRSEGEIRDVSVVRYANGRWSEPRPVHRDGWEIPGCPVNGPSVAASDRKVAVAWYTNAGNSPRVKVAFSTDAGTTFGEPVQIDGGSPLGRVDTAILDDGSVVVCWLERTAAGAEIRIRRVTPDRQPGPVSVVALTATDRASGFPSVARSGDHLVFAWTRPGSPSRVLTAVRELKDFLRAET